jgi:type IV pilus assembly protein PilQ
MKLAVLKYICVLNLAFFVIFSAVPASVTADEPDGNAAIENKPANGDNPVNQPQTQREWLRKKVSYSCVDKPIEAVLMELAEQVHVDIVKSPKVVGSVTVKLTDIPLEEALTNILAAHDYTYIATDTMIRVVPLPEVAVIREPLDTRIYKIIYADANNVADALTGFVSDRGKVAFNRGTNHIVVTDTESKIKIIDKFIEQLDSPTSQIVVEVRIYEITSNEDFEFSSSWSAARNTPLKTTDHTNVDTSYDAVPRKTQNTTTVTGPSATTTNETVTGNYRDSQRAAGSMTTVGTTTQTGVTNTETQTTETTIPKRFDTEIERYTEYKRKPVIGGSFDRTNGGTLSLSLLDNAIDLDLALSMLHQKVEAKLLANPRVLVLDNETATFEIVREIPYRELMQVDRTGGITYTAFKNVGVQLRVTPHIVAGGMIKLHIEPEYGILVSQSADGVPTVDTRRANTIAMINDGQTVVLGGLRKKETSKDVAKVPILGDIPIAGLLFQSRIESEHISELVVFITPKISVRPMLSKSEKAEFGQTKTGEKDFESIEAEQQYTEQMLKSLSETK